MIALYIFLGILAFLFLVLGIALSLKLVVRAGYTQSPLLIVKVGPFTFRIMDGTPKEEQPPKEPKPEKKAKPAKPKKEKKEKKRKPLKGEPPTLLDLITAFKDLAVGLLTDLAHQIKIEELRLRVRIASDDAAKTALMYGSACALVQPVQSVAFNAPRVNRKKLRIAVEVDFLDETPDFDAELCVSTTGWRILSVGLKAVPGLLRAIKTLKRFKQASLEKKEAKELANAEKQALKEQKAAEKQKLKEAKAAERYARKHPTPPPPPPEEPDPELDAMDEQDETL